jgi:hypothetical protein
MANGRLANYNTASNHRETTAAGALPAPEVNLQKSDKSWHVGKPDKWVPGPTWTVSAFIGSWAT